MFNSLFGSATRFMREDEGATAIEYALMAAILAIGIIGTVGGISEELNETFDGVSGELAANNTP